MRIRGMSDIVRAGMADMYHHANRGDRTHSLVD